ncbi:DNA polymerase lambda [Salmo trutta]|uniref:DNA polymerase lambda n=1 Tax=Salmo trutta TaxID=8032 RepID=A0A674BGL4_SALTR|nr:DNA polymerase lambda-like [Salmo trutta]
MYAYGIMKAFPKVKRTGVREGKDAPPPKRKSDETVPVTGSAFQGVTIHILPAGIGNARCQIFQRQIVQNGGQTESSLCPTVTHVVVDDSMDCDRALRLLKVDRLPSGVYLLKCTWLSTCISEQRLLDTADYSLLNPDKDMETTKDGVKEDVLNSIPLPATQDMKQPISDETKPDESTETVQDTKDDFKDEYGVSQSDLEALISGLYPKDETPSTATAPSDPQQKPLSGKWVCAQSSKSKVDNHNKHITDKLEVLAKAYTHQGDRWRALGYSKAINALKSYHKPITSYEEACKIQGIGKKMADKVMEIMESGHLRKIDHFGEAVPVLEMFTNIWGAGAKTAQLWYTQGFRTLEDIRTKANLNHNQIIGLKHYDDFLDRMPREEAAAIEKTVKEAAQFLDPGLLAMACGSYRRGKDTCGDVDVLISHPDGKSHRGVFSKVLQSLHQSGFLTDDLVSHEESGEQKKYMGVCRLPGPGRLHRRLDIIVVPYGEFACSLMYFTGSAHFNRSMRALAKTKRMSLSEHSLNSDVLRQGSLKVYGGTPLPTLTEKDVFTHLGIPFREPQERDW